MILIKKGEKFLMLVINTSFELAQKTGIGAYILTLLETFKILDVKYKTIELKIPKWFKFKYFWQLLWLNTIVFVQTLIEKPKIFFSPSFLMPYLTRKDTQYITVIHDLAFYRGNEVSKYVKFIFNLSLKIAIKKADIIIVVSQSIKEELIEKCNIEPNKIKVIYNSLDKKYLLSKNINTNIILDKYNIKPQKYILSVATLHKRKNIPALISAFEQISERFPDLKLVLVGGMGNEQRAKLTRHTNIIFTGYVSDEEIPPLYKNALLYVFPSLYEGFGIPLIEAQASNCPVICSDIPVFREVAGDAAEFCSPTAQGILEKIELLINNQERRDYLTQLGLENIKRFSIDKIVQQLKEVIDES
jgi:glycosyltransferase involved in cell wall biosynthesis